MNLLTKKMTCRGCKAFFYFNNVDFSCELHYSQKIIHVTNFFVDVIPLEKCPKPKTNGDFIIAFKNYMNKDI